MMNSVFRKCSFLKKLHFAKCTIPRHHPPHSSVLAARAAGEHTGHRTPQIASASRGLIKD